MNISKNSHNQFRKVIRSANNEAYALVTEAYSYFKSLQNAGIAIHVKWYHFCLTIDKMVASAMARCDGAQSTQFIALKIIPVQDHIVITIKNEGTDTPDGPAGSPCDVPGKKSEPARFRRSGRQEMFRGNRITVRL